MFNIVQFEIYVNSYGTAPVRQLTLPRGPSVGFTPGAFDFAHFFLVTRPAAHLWYLVFQRCMF
mgnify:CR=1 FL=1